MNPYLDTLEYAFDMDISLLKLLGLYFIYYQKYIETHYSIKLHI